MKTCGRSCGVWVCCFIFVTGPVCGQNLVLNDSVVLVSFKDLESNGPPLVLFRLKQDLEYSVNCSNVLFMNWQQEDNPGQLSLNQHLNFRSKLTNERKLLISGAFIHDLGVQYFFDSIARFYPDGNTLDIKMEVKSGRRLSIFISSRFATRLFNGYDIESDQSGGNQRILNSSFMTPLVCNFAAGLSLNNKWMGSLNMGITGAKLTYIRNKEIYSSLNVDEFFGVAKGKNFKFEYGLSLQILIDRDIFKSVHWNCDLMVFKNFNKPVELSLKNQIGVRISRFIKGMVQTRLQYNDEVSLHLQLENTVTAGFFIKW